MRIGQIVIAVVTTVGLAACTQSHSPLMPDRPSASGQADGISVLSGRSASSAPRDQEVPFKGSFEGVFTVNDVTPTLVSETIEATGNGTQLGRFTLEVPHTINPDAHQLSGTYRFTAANGDTLVATFTGTSTVTAPGVVAVVDNATIIDGTGRFSGATGSFTVQRVVTFATTAISGSYDGTISSPGANKQ